MAHKEEQFNLPLRAASAIAQYVPVRFTGDAGLFPGSAISESVVRAGSSNEDVLGMTLATVASPGAEVAVAVNGVSKGIAGASIGAGARLIVGSTNGILIPFIPTGAAASGPLRTYSIGKSLRNAVAGDIFAVFLDPEQFT
jgi:hypothetical protein